MRVLLVYPYFLETRVHEDDIRAMPMGLYAIGAVLKEAGHEVALFNGYGFQGQGDRIRDMIARFKPDVVGCSILHANRWGGIEIARRAKAVDAGIVTVFGGVGASFLWEHLLTHFPEVDYVVIGEGERTILKLLASIAAGDGEGMQRIGGLARRLDGRPTATPGESFEARLDRLPNPARYFTYQHVALTRGCPAACRFCGSPAFWGRKVRYHSAGWFVDQLELLFKKGVRFFYFSDDTFTLRKRLVVEVCQEILARRLAIQWVAISRVDTVDETVLAWMRKAGCIQISYGIESGSRAIRAFLNKKITSADIHKAFALTTRYGILPRAYFIYGCPGDSDVSIQETLDLIRAVKPLDAIFYILDIFPGTDLYRDYRLRTGKDDDIWRQRIEDLLYFETDPRMSAEKVRMWGQTLREGFYRLLPDFVTQIELVDDPAFYRLHADFLSRLGLTFQQGDFARIAAIPNKDRIARDLYKRALRYHPDARAFLGLALREQQRGAFEAAAATVRDGLVRNPGDATLTTCLAVNYMNMGAFNQALAELQRLQETPDTVDMTIACLEALGRDREADEGRRKRRPAAGGRPDSDKGDGRN
ncbi:MAG: cobalamin-dependent protein [Desulfosarcina sp.]|nr:cobalamin-dependent protein [Desulfobacterales bacterium]